jgi:antirestriction protein
MTTPRIYVASLADYNGGRLHGTWIDLDGKDYDEVWEEVKAMLAKSREPVAEEWAIHDYEGFGPLRVEEWSDLKRLALYGQAVDDLDEEDTHAFFAFMDNEFDVDMDLYEDDPEGLRDRFREFYMGKYDSFKDFVLQSEEGDMWLGLDHLKTVGRDDYRMDARQQAATTEMVERLIGYIDWDQVARDMEHEYTVVKASEYGVHVFRDNA